MERFEPLLTAPLAVQIHVATVLPAAIIGAWLLFLSTKGARLHRYFGAIYLALMTATAIAAAFIRTHSGVSLAGFSLIHLFVPLTFWGVYSAIQGVRTQNYKRHGGAMQGLFLGAILIAGALTFLPGRIMHAIVLG